MARRQLVITCSSCDAPLRSDGPFCESCGRPTPWATHDERIAWEVRQWRASKSREPETSGPMMLVRTDDGYVAVPDRPADFIWDQPLHPERDNPARANPHAAVRPTPERAESAAEPVAALTAMLHTPAPPAIEERPSPAPEPAAAGVDVDVALPRVVAQPAPYVERVTISKKAVAVAVALVIGLPFGGTIVGLVRGGPAGKPVARAAGAPVQALPKQLGSRAGFSQVSPDAARYAVLITNPNNRLTARGVTVTIKFVDRTGSLLGTQLERVASIPSGATVAVAGESGVAGTVARIEARFAVGAFEAGPTDRAASVERVRLSSRGGTVTVRATIAGRPARDVRVVVVHFDRAGHLLGGDFTYVDLSASRVTTAVVSTAQAAHVARVKVFVLLPR